LGSRDPEDGASGPRPGQKVHKILFQPMQKWVGWYVAVNPGIREVEEEVSHGNKTGDLI
jgi:hypothetical protein